LDSQGEQTEEVEAPMMALAVPMGHSVQVAWPSDVAKLPAEQYSHANEPFVDHFPTGHFKHADGVLLPGEGLYLPAAHPRQKDEFVLPGSTLYFPDGQAIQEEKEVLPKAGL